MLPPQQRIDETWYKGTADAIYQNIYTIESENAEHVLILAGDHIYKMDYGGMIRAHRERDADLTIGCIPVPLADGKHFGIMQVGDDDRVVSFLEKPKAADPMPGDPEHALGSMGIYVFNARLHVRAALPGRGPRRQRSRLRQEHHPADDRGRAARLRLPLPRREPQGGPVLARRRHARRLLPGEHGPDRGRPGAEPVRRDWPIRTYQPQLPPPKFVFSADGPPGHARRGEALDSMVCPGCIVSGGQVRRSILSPSVRVNSYAVVEDSILFDGVDVGRHCRIRRAIIDKDVKIPPHTVIGYDRSSTAAAASRSPTAAS